ncbi:MAG: hypothetical protein ACOCTG_05405, partial [Bacteroidota bacterium]
MRFSRYLRDEWQTLAFCMIAGVLLLAGAGCQHDQSISPIDTVAALDAIHERSEAGAQPVSLRARVIFHDPYWRILFVQDETGGLYLNPGDLPQVSLGHTVSVEGHSNSRTGRIDSLRITPEASGSLPRPQSISIERINAFESVSELVEVRGIVRSARIASQRLELVVEENGHRVLARILEYPSDLEVESLVRAHVRLLGVNSLLFDDRIEQVLGVQLFVQSTELLNLEQEGLPVEDIPVTSVGTLLDVPHEFPDGSVIRTRGRIAHRDESSIFLGGDGNHLRILNSSLSFAVGDSVEVVGFSREERENILIEDATIRHFWRAGRRLGDDADLPVLTRVGAIRELSSSEARRHYPVRISGVITYADPAWSMIFVQDATGGVYVAAPSFSSDTYRPGQVVEVEGVTQQTAFAPDIINPVIRVVGLGTPPTPLNEPLDRLLSGQLDSQWIRVDGVVRSVAGNEEGHAFLFLQVATHRIEVQLPPGSFGPSLPKHLIDAKVSVSGVSGTLFNDRGQLIG